MKYDPIELEVDENGIDFYFVRPNGKRWFYQIHSLENEKDIEFWDKHMQEKMWYTPEIRKETIEKMQNLMKKI